MKHDLWLQDLPPLTTMAARRLLFRGRVDLDIPGFGLTGILKGRLTMESGKEIHLSLREISSMILASCPECLTDEAIPCSHATAVLLSFREHLKKSDPPNLRPGQNPGRDGRLPSLQTGDLLSQYPCNTLVLTGSKRAPVFVALTGKNAPMDHEAFHRLQGRGTGRPDTRSSLADLFLSSFEPCHVPGKDGSPLPGFRPRGSESEAIFRYFRNPEVSVYSARTRTPYKIGFLSKPPLLDLRARWVDSPGQDLIVEGQILIESGIQVLKNILWMTFGPVSILCGNGALLFFLQESLLDPARRRLMERSEEGHPLTPGEWAPLLDPTGGNPGAPLPVTFDPPSLAPVFGPRSRWTPVVTIRGRSDGAVALLPRLSFSEQLFVPLFGPERHRMGDYLKVSQEDSESAPFLIGRDRERELYFRNLFEKIARLSSSDASILVEKSRTGNVLDNLLPALESAGFTLDRSGLFDGSLLPGPVHVRLVVSPLSRGLVRVQGIIETGAGIFQFPPLCRKSASQTEPAEDSWVIAVDEERSVYLEGQAREHFRDLHQLFDLDREGAGSVSHFYVSMLKSLRPDLPIVPTEELSRTLIPFSPAPLPTATFERLSSSFAPTLRPYQKDAVSFLHSLWQEGLSGILADEMGLGKTVSVLGFLTFMKMENLFPRDTRPPLIALPASLLYNWVHEAKRFCPGIRLHIHAGSSRKERISDIDSADLILTTYGTIRNDPHLSSGPPFSCLVLDEAHMVKNPDSRTHRAILSLPSFRRIAVTGTPVENRMTDLWGIFNILMPGFLGSRLLFEHRFFRENEGGAGRNSRIELLRNLLSPLILRRTKENVLSDLPPKVEVDIWIDPTKEEHSLYSRLKARGTEEIHSSNFQAGPLRMAYLTLLLRLRQLACHPALLPEEIRGSLTRSSKFDLVLEKLSEGTAEGHKILLFSQFTAILDLFEAALPERGITSVRLDGSTPLPERKKRVDAFQSEGPGSPSVFLASLKAGGVGLTLTRADYVFHYDPWWNPQVEAQASDRSHRIGQDKKVFVYRFLVRGTVEERVRILKESKKEIFDLLMNSQYDAPSDRITGTLSIGDMLDLLDFETPSDEKD